MSRRRYRLRPPTSPAYKSGQVLTFAESDAPPPSKLIELKPVGPPPLVLEFKAEDEMIPRPEAEKPPPIPREPTS